jgi:hypothetical protein
MAAVNFEDLFDFSPQGDQPDTEELDTYVEKTAESLFRPSIGKFITSSSIAAKSYDQSSSFKLSVSLPTALSARLINLFYKTI